MPFFDVEDEVGACLESIGRQTFSDIEVILVDDGSLDRSLDVAQRFVARDGRFRIVRQENQGLGPARNTGMAEATGKYLTFVDSDDIVSRHGFAAMIRTLEETGSSFAAGMVRRFDGEGVRESWAHRLAFAEDRRATHISELQALVTDRMIWNKVFRRDFWRERDFRFPAIRYEDYPVTLPAHVDAGAVDCLSMPVYYWRARGTGSSITQQADRLDNLADRVRSAEMVLDIADARAPTVAPAVHRHLAEIDLVALLQAFAAARDDDGELVALGRRFLTRLDPEAVESARSYDRLQHHALRAGDADYLRRLARFRAAGRLRGGVRARRRGMVASRYELEYPGLDDRPRPAPRARFAIGRGDLDAVSTADDIHWDGDRLVVKGTAQIAHLAMSARSRLAIALATPGWSRPCRVRRFDAVDRLGFEVDVEADLIAGAPPGPLSLVAQIDDGPLHRRNRVLGPMPDSVAPPPGRWLAPHVWAQPERASDGRLVISRTDPWALDAVVIRGDHLALSGGAPRTSDRSGRLVVRRVSDRAGRPVPMRYHRVGRSLRFSACLSLASIVDGATPDDPVTGCTVWSLAVDGDDAPLLATGVDEDVTSVVGGRRFRVTRSLRNEIVIIEAPLEVTPS